MSKKIAIIGASEQQNPLILKAKELGLQTHTFAWQTGGEIGEKTSDFFYPISAENKEAILAKCKALGVDAVVSIASDIAARSAAFVANALDLPGNRYAAVMLATNKIATRRLLKAHGIFQPSFVSVGDVLPIDELQALRYPLIVKPSDRSAGRGLSVVEKPEELFSAINAAREVSFERQAIVEELVDGALYSCECLSYRGKHRVLGFTRRQTMRLGSRILEKTHTQPAVLPASVEKTVREQSAVILSLLGLTEGASSIEFIVSEGKPYIVEITPTMYGDYIGTDLLPLAYGYDYLAAVLDIALGKEPSAMLPVCRSRAMVRFAYSAEDGAENAPAVPDGRRYGHRIFEEPIKAFGGYPALKLPEGKPYFCEGSGVLALNSEYTAFACALKDIGAKRVHIPYYGASAWERIACALSVECVFYHIDERFLPIDLAPAEEDAVLLSNYHGLLSSYLQHAPFKNKIVDHSMAFFAPPILSDGVYNIYSCRKFFAVADGAYLVAKHLPDLASELPTDVSYLRAAALLRALECGEAHKEMQANEQELVSARARMSHLTKRMLSALDYEEERKKRARIFARMHGALREYNQLSVDLLQDLAPQFYPLLVDGDIREQLIEKKIYTPLMWRKTLSNAFEGLAEKRFSERLVCLPISTEDTDGDVSYLLEVVLAAIT